MRPKRTTGHLDGKRTGRPAGSKSKSGARRDILWAYRHLGHKTVEGARPTAQAWLDFANNHRERFLQIVLKVDAFKEGEEEAEAAAAGELPAGPVEQLVTRLIQEWDAAHAAGKAG